MKEIEFLLILIVIILFQINIGIRNLNNKN